MPDSARTTNGVTTHALKDLPWVETNKPGVRLASVRMDREDGLFLGFVAMDQFAETGLHHHLGPASSYVLQGALTDYQGPIVAGECGINLKGATHNAIAYEDTLLVARLDAPVIYADESEAAGTPIHTGGFQGEIVNHTPEVMPEIHVDVEAMPWLPTAVAGVVRRNLWNYDQTGMDRRMRQIQILPGTSLPALRMGGLTDIFLMSGDLSAAGQTVGNGGFMVLEEGAEVSFTSRYGALAIVWAEAPSQWVDDQAKPELWGF